MSTQTSPVKEIKPQPAQPRARAQQTPEEYLAEAGWTTDPHTGLWADPKGSTAKATKREISIPRRDGTVEKVRQSVGPPIPWSYTLHDAVLIQRGRDAAK